MKTIIVYAGIGINRHMEIIKQKIEEQKENKVLVEDKDTQNEKENKNETIRN